MKTHIFLLIFTLILLINPVEAINPTYCAEINNLSCENCVAIYTGIYQNGKITEYYTVGNWFYYIISLSALSEDIPQTTFTVSVKNPEGEQIGTLRTYVIDNIENTRPVFLSPKQTEKSNTFDIYEFDSTGVYSVNITSDKKINFYRFYEDCVFSFNPNSAEYHFEVMPRWQYETNNKIINMTEAIIFLTLVLVFLTTVLVIWSMRSLIDKHIRILIVAYSISLIFLPKSPSYELSNIILLVASGIILCNKFKNTIYEKLALVLVYIITALLAMAFYGAIHYMYSEFSYQSLLFYTAYFAYSITVLIGSHKLLIKRK